MRLKAFQHLTRCERKTTCSNMAKWPSTKKKKKLMSEIEIRLLPLFHSAKTQILMKQCSHDGLI